MKERLDERTIALRVAKEFKDGDVVNLGYGMPSLAADFIPEGRTVLFQYEIGLLGTGPLAAPGTVGGMSRPLGCLLGTKA